MVDNVLPRSSSSSAPNIGFIRENPAIAAYDLVTRNAQQEALNDLAIERGMTDNAYNRRANPSRLRSVEATADVDEGTVGSRIDKSVADARTAGAEADYQTGVVPYRIRSTAAGTRNAEAGADVNEQSVPFDVNVRRVRSRMANVEAGVAEDTAADKVRQSGARTRSLEADAQKAQMDAFHQSLELLNQGDTEGAQLAMRQAGMDPFPESFLRDREMRAAVSWYAKRAKELYPDRPQNQQAFIDSSIGEIKARRARGEPVWNAPDSYALPPGAPQPPTGDETAPSQRISVFQQKQAAWLATHPGDQQGALDYASGRRQISPVDVQRMAYQQARAEINGNFNLRFKSQQEREAAINRRQQEIAQVLSGSQPVQQPPQAPQPAPQPAPGNPQDPRRPLNIQMPPRPPAVPPGSAYSPARGMWRSPDGRVFDPNGNPVQQ